VAGSKNEAYNFFSNPWILGLNELKLFVKMEVASIKLKENNPS